MFGVTANGNSIGVHVHNFTPYFYVKVDTRKVELTASDLLAIKDNLNKWSNNSGE